jgi:hypothetical protein
MASVVLCGQIKEQQRIWLAEVVKKTVPGPDDSQLIANKNQFIQLRWNYKTDYWKEWLPIKKISISREG